MRTLFDRARLGTLSLKNRCIRAATWERMARAGGHLSPALMRMYAELAEGGVSLIETGYASVFPWEQPNPGMMGMHDDRLVEEYAVLSGVVHDGGSRLAMQLAYGGSQTRYLPSSRLIWGPSAVKHPVSGVVPTPMSMRDIGDLAEGFAAAAARSKDAGCDGVMVHAAHGYLLGQFLSPLFNRRMDDYGGSLPNRARIILDVYGAVREAVGRSYPVLIKINCSDFVDGGATFADCMYVCRELDKRGIDAVEVSGGGVPPGAGHSYYRDYGACLSCLLSAPVILVGGNRDPVELQHILEDTKLSFFSFSRPLLREPGLIARWERGDRSPAACTSCGECFHDEGNYCPYR